MAPYATCQQIIGPRQVGHADMACATCHHDSCVEVTWHAIWQCHVSPRARVNSAVVNPCATCHLDLSNYLSIVGEWATCHGVTPGRDKLHF